MTDVRWQRTFEFMVQAGMVKPDLDYKRAYTLDVIREVKVLP
jgi:NitT/TauT family transport system substrate-binding protein